MRQINENKNEKKKNAIINKIFEEMKYTEEYIKKWNITLTEYYDKVYSLDLYYLYQSSKESFDELEKKYRNQYNLLDIEKYIKDKIKLDINYGQPLKKVKIYDKTETSYVCEFYQVNWIVNSSSKTTRKFIFNNNGDIIYQKNKKKSKNIDYITKYNINNNDLEMTFNLEDTSINISFYDNIQYINIGNLSIESTIINGYKKISLKEEQDNQTITYEIEIDRYGKILNKCIIIKKYNKAYQIEETYELYYKQNELTGALYFDKENKKYNMLENSELTKKAIELDIKLDKNNIIFNSNTKELENLVIETKSQIFKLIKEIKNDITLYGLEKRIEIALSNINAKAKKIEKKENNEKEKYSSKKNIKTKKRKK